MRKIVFVHSYEKFPGVKGEWGEAYENIFFLSKKYYFLSSNYKRSLNTASSTIASLKGFHGTYFDYIRKKCCFFSFDRYFSLKKQNKTKPAAHAKRT